MEKTITIQVNDQMLKEFGNALSAYGDICFSATLNSANVPPKFEFLKEEGIEELHERFKNVKNLYLQIEKQLNT